MPPRQNNGSKTAAAAATVVAASNPPAAAPSLQDQQQPAPSSKRTLSLSMASGSPAPSPSTQQPANAVHPLRLSWLFWFVNRQPGLKVASQTAYEDSIKKVGGFASIESFWTIFTHLQPPSQLPPVTDILLFSSAVRPLWEEVPRGAKFTLRLRKGISDRLWEDLVLAAVGDQFDEREGVVGVVLSVRAAEDVLSVWTERSDGPSGGNKLKEAIFRLLNLPANTNFEYRLNSDLIQSTSRPSALERAGSHRNGAGVVGASSTLAAVAAASGGAGAGAGAGDDKSRDL